MVFFVDIGVPQRTRGSTTASLGCDFVFTNWECDPSCLSAIWNAIHKDGISACRKSLFAPLPVQFSELFKFRKLLDWTRKGPFAPFTLSPLLYCRTAFYRFLTASNAIHKDGISSLKYGPRGGLRRFARPTHRTSHIDLADCTKSCIRLCVFRGRIGFCEFWTEKRIDTSAAVC